MPSVSVILPTCDRPALLPRAVESVLAQTEVDFDVVLVDSNRATVPVMEAHHGAPWLTDSRVRVVRPPLVTNAAQARNAGLAMVTGEWVSYLDDDDVYRAGKLSQQLALAQRTSRPVVLCGAEFVLRGRRRQVQCESREWRGDELLLRARWNTPLVLHRRKDEVRFDETLGANEDAEFCHRFLEVFGLNSVPVVPLPLVEIHPQAGARVNTSADSVRRVAKLVCMLGRLRFSDAARRRFQAQARLAEAKLGGQRLAVFRTGIELLWLSRGADWRAVANAALVVLGFFPGRWVS